MMSPVSTDRSALLSTPRDGLSLPHPSVIAGLLHLLMIFLETFAPVAKMNSVRVLLSLAANLDWLLYQFDVKNAFLHGDLEEEINFRTDSMRLYCDNKAAINIAHNPVQHDRTKHVEIDRHFIKEKLTSGTICTPFVQSGEQLADILTKGIGNKPFHDILGKLGMRDIFAPT
ncbi:hypothetical protein CsSME_00020123 [Camellia sinensis var. sinensis]